ncbi:redoxin family protein [Roseiconus nitratireducens]|uniref:Redoxin family protein n=1 Tax=Roseiconus nitratireducens TaxID=2605748 RepID=A0A5M6D595_9BACT|nr:M56 family metallopeptidase [Roseiconus nitratireducens]KAA5542688.1 redoxin family protein [Roseiconus nitratireducens]
MHQNVILSTWLLDVFVKASLFLAIVWLGSLVLRKRSAAAQHRWWTLGFVGCLLIPVVSVVSPGWTPACIPAWMQIGAEPQVSTIANSEPPAVFSSPRNDGSLPFIEVRQQRPVVTRASRPPAEERGSSMPRGQESPGSEVAPAASATASLASSFAFSWSRMLVIVWGTGAGIILLRAVWRHWLLNRMLGRCTRLMDEDWIGLLSETSRMLGVRGRVQLLEHPEAHSPVSSGVWHPAVILPNDARCWSLERRRLVLLHELAHVARRDVLAQTVARLAFGLYWFHPLAWYGLLQMRKLRETACDDLVLSCGQQPAGYADVLLDIARSYRHQANATAVGMAHSSNVESRIMAILDSTRRHVSLSRTSARMLFAFAAALVCLVGTAEFQTRAQTPSSDTEKETESETQASDSADASLRDMRIRILDDQGKPLEGAMLQIGVWYAEGYDGYRTPKQHTADANGMVVLRLPKRLNILRLWPKQPGYVGQFKNFGQGTHREGELIPDELEFRLAKGHPIGGRIVDEAGQPIEGVHVRVKVDDVPGVSTWLTDSFGQPTVKTDSNGRWQLNNAPAQREKGTDWTFELKLSHDDFVTDKYWGESQRAQGVGTAELRRGAAEVVLHRGTPVHGTVVDREGKPVTKGWVVWSDEPYFNDGVFEAELQGDGSFRTPPLPEAEYPITIVAPGFAAQRRMIKVGSDSAEQPFELQPGKRITIRFVDSAGSPVPKVGVYLANSSASNTWQGSNALHNHKHPNVPDYGIPRQANEQGVFVWDWAPEEPVRYSVGAKGFARQEIALVAKSDPHVVTLASARVATGLVTDKTTGEPIADFQVMPVIVFRPNFFSTRYADVKQGAQGRYELPLTGSADPNDRYRVRFEAEGYRSIISEESFGPLDGRATLNAQLERAPARKGRVLDAKGTPVANASVLEGTPTWVPNTSNGEPSGFRERIGETDSDGRFELGATTEPVRLRVLHEAGFVEKLLQPEDDSVGELKLQPWAKVSGRLMRDGKPVGNQSIYFSALVNRGLGEPRFQDSYHAQTGPDGTFSFERLPPVTGSLRPYLGPWRDSPLTSAQSLPLELRPGERREVELGGDGAVLTGQVVATGRDEVPLDRQYSLNYLVSRDRSIRELPEDFPPLSFDPSSPMQLAWSLDPHFSDYLATREHHFVKLTPDGDLRVTGIAPGDYDLVIRLYEQPAGCLVETVGEKIVPVQVRGDETMDLGRIEVPCRAGPRPGSDMRAFEFVDATGEQQTVNEMAGRHVLMQVWASWCAPCLASMPDIQHTADDLAADAVTFVGLNIDEDSGQASRLAKQMNWSWCQNYLGEGSDMARQLAISSVPTYYLIGPDGKLVASATEWTDIKKQLAASLAATNE